VIQLLPESPGPHRLLEVLAGRRQDPDVHRLGLRAPQAPDRAILKDGQKLGLEALGQQPDLVEEEGAPVCSLEQARLGLPRIGEGAPLEPEQLGFEKRFGDGRTVNGDEGPLRAGSGVVHRAGKEAFARTRLADQEQ
jgi:hypothetical protein